MELVDDGLLGAELLAHLDGVVRAVIGAAAAGHALLLVDLGDVVALGEVRGVEVLRHAQREAALDLAVADGEGLALMQGRDLVHAADVVGLLDDGLGLVDADRTAPAVVGEEVGDAAHEQAVILIDIAGALAHHAADAAALTWRDVQVAFVILNVLRAALVVDLLRVGRDGALHGDDAHDAGTHGGVHGVLFLAGGRVLMEGVGDLRMRLDERLVRQQELEDAGGVRGQQVNLEIDLRHDDLHDETDLGDLVQNLSRALDGHLGLLRNQRNEGRLHAGQCLHDLDLLVRDPLLKCPVLCAIRGDFVETVIDLLT